MQKELNRKKKKTKKKDSSTLTTTRKNIHKDKVNVLMRLSVESTKIYF